MKLDEDLKKRTNRPPGKVLFAYSDLAILLFAALTAIGFSIFERLQQEHLFQIIASLLALIGVSLLRARLRFDSLSEQLGTLNQQIKLGLDYLGTSLSIWKAAVSLLRPMTEGCTAYDTSSYPNEADYESALVKAVKNGGTFKRIFCFSSTNLSMQSFFEELMNRRHDPESNHSAHRSAIESGSITILHYPHELTSDFLLVEKDRTPQGAVVGFHTDRHDVAQQIYSWGFSVDHPDACRDLRELISNVILEGAYEHLAEELEKAENERCCCCKYLHDMDGQQKLMPLSPQTNLPIDKGT